MGRRVLEFARLHPDTSPALVAAVARLQERLDRAEELDRQFMDGRSAVHVATARRPSSAAGSGGPTCAISAAWPKWPRWKSRSWCGSS